MREGALEAGGKCDSSDLNRRMKRKTAEQDN